MLLSSSLLQKLLKKIVECYKSVAERTHQISGNIQLISYELATKDKILPLKLVFNAKDSCSNDNLCCWTLQALYELSCSSDNGQFEFNCVKSIFSQNYMKSLLYD